MANGPYFRFNAGNKIYKYSHFYKKKKKMGKRKHTAPYII